MSDPTLLTKENTYEVERDAIYAKLEGQFRHHVKDKNKELTKQEQKVLLENEKVPKRKKDKSKYSIDLNKTIDNNMGKLEDDIQKIIEQL